MDRLILPEKLLPHILVGENDFYEEGKAEFLFTLRNDPDKMAKKISRNVRNGVEATSMKLVLDGILEKPVLAHNPEIDGAKEDPVKIAAWEDEVSWEIVSALVCIYLREDEFP